MSLPSSAPRLAAFAVSLSITVSATADVFNMPTGQTSLQMATVGNPGNPSDARLMSDGTSSYGSVGYDYRIGKFEVTASQYVAFLNATAKTDAYGLYQPEMADAYGSRIVRNGSAGSYTYFVDPAWANRPADHITWGSAARFANWLTNGQPTGAQAPGTTEDGSYLLNGTTTNGALLSVTRKTVEQGGRYYIPTENEWYKAAYYDPTRSGGNYWLYPMRTDADPFSVQPPGTNSPNAAISANYYNDDGLANGYNGGFAVTGSTIFSSSQNYLTDVGAYVSASSYYGTFDQGGNLLEWNESIVGGARGLRGGSWGNGDSPFSLRAWRRGSGIPAQVNSYFGLRIVEVPEPATLSLVAIAAATLSRRPSRRQRA